MTAVVPFFCDSVGDIRWMYFCLACLVYSVFLSGAGCGGVQYLARVPARIEKSTGWHMWGVWHRATQNRACVYYSTSAADPFRSRQESDEAVKGMGAGVLWRSAPEQCHLFLHGLRSQRDKVPLVSFTNSVLIAWKLNVEDKHRSLSERTEHRKVRQVRLSFCPWKCKIFQMSLRQKAQDSYL